MPSDSTPRAGAQRKKHFRVSASFVVWGVLLSLPMIGFIIVLAVGAIERDNVALALGVAVAQGCVYLAGGLVHACLRPKADEESESPAIFPDFIEGVLILGGGAIALVSWLLSLAK